MTRTIITRIALGPLAALLLGASAVHAGGLQLSLQAGSARDAQLLGAAITLYSIHRDIRAGADVRQVGRNHTAALRQSGGGNQAIIHQRGRDHDARLDQQGGGNSQVIVQVGRGARADVTQTGGQSGILLQFAR